MLNFQLKVKKTPKEKNNAVVLSVEAPKELSEKAYTLALRDATNLVDIPGFRKGKAPKEMVEKKLGRGYISQKAFEGIFYELIADVQSQEKLSIVDVVEISSFELLPEKPLTFSVVVELKPEVNLGKYKGLKVKAKKFKFDKKEFVTKTLDKIANNLATFVKVSDRGIKEGDIVVIDFNGTFEDGSEIPGGKAENFQTVIEKGKFLPEFLEKLIGLKVGETREVDISFPENYEKSLSGKKAKFNVAVKGIEEKVIPEINEELAKKVNMENLDALKKKIDEQMHDIQERNSRADLENKLIDEIIKSSKYDVSARMINNEIDYLLHDIKAQCQKESIDWEAFKSDQKNKDLISRANDAAIKRISIDLVLDAVIKKEQINATKDEIEEELTKQISYYGDKYKGLENSNRLRNIVELNILRNKAVDFLLDKNEAIWDEEVVSLNQEQQ